MRRPMREIMALADDANLYIDEHKPWLLAKDPARAAEVQAVCTQGLNLFRVLTLYLKPVLPRLAAGAENSSAPRRDAGRTPQCRCSRRDRTLRAAGDACRPGGRQSAARSSLDRRLRPADMPATASRRTDATQPATPRA